MSRGHIEERGKDTFRLKVELEPDAETGARRYRRETFHGSKDEAEKRLTDMLYAADRRQLPASDKTTVGDYLERWLDDYASAKTPKTYAFYQDTVRRYIVPHVGRVRLDKLAPAHVVRLLTTLRNQPRRDGREGKLSPRTVKHTHAVLHSALACAVKWQIIPTNPADNVDTPSVPRKEMRTYTAEQAQAFLAASVAEGLRWQAFFTLWLNAGSRPGELKALRWVDVDLDRGSVAIQQSEQRVRHVGHVVGQPKTAGSRRPIALGPSLASLLRQHRTDQRAERLRMGPLWVDNGLVFPSESGTYLDDGRVHKVFARICERAGLPRIRPYDLRHSSASLLLAAGVHPKVVAERLGHSTVNLTLNTYSHVLPTLQQDAANTLEAMLRKA